MKQEGRDIAVIVGVLEKATGVLCAVELRLRAKDLGHLRTILLKLLRPAHAPCHEAQILVTFANTVA